jgi:hypothetical protein
VLIVNADDWGADATTTDSIATCLSLRTVSAVSGMVFMQDSARAAAIARERGIDVGLHLNFTTAFSGDDVPATLRDRQQTLTAFLRSHRLAQTVFHPGLVRTFEYVVAAQIDEYRRLYSSNPARYDGHHHMHLCANVLLQRLLPPQARVRRSFSFGPGDKGLINRLYRRGIDGFLRRARYRLTDYFFHLAPIGAARLGTIARLAREHVVEVETHPADAREYQFLTGGTIFEQLGLEQHT